MPWSLLLNRYVLIGIAFALLSGYAGIQTRRLASAKAQEAAIQASYDAFKAQVAQDGKAAQDAANQAVARQKQTLTATKGKYESQIAALRQFYASRGLPVGSDSPISGQLSAAGANPGGADAVAEELGYCRRRLEACAEDALTLKTLQDFLVANGHPIQP
jgi:hypothetical protein